MPGLGLLGILKAHLEQGLMTEVWVFPSTEYKVAPPQERAAPFTQDKGNLPVL